MVADGAAATNQPANSRLNQDKNQDVFGYVCRWGGWNGLRWREAGGEIWGWWWGLLSGQKSALIVLLRTSPNWLKYEIQTRTSSSSSFSSDPYRIHHPSWWNQEASGAICTYIMSIWLRGTEHEEEQGKHFMAGKMNMSVCLNNNINSAFIRTHLRSCL